VAAIATIVLGGLLLAGTAHAQEAGVDVHSGTAAPGEEESVVVGAHDIGAPGLGAWSIDIIYDDSVITAVGCTADEGGVCNPNFADDTVRISGATAGGLEGDTALGTIDFECNEDGGESDLTLDAATFADATVGGPVEIDVTISNGTFTCVSGGPATGTGFTTDGSTNGWLLAVLAYLGVAALAVGALRWRTR
jgi:hypothetical protein